MKKNNRTKKRGSMRKYEKNVRKKENKNESNIFS